MASTVPPIADPAPPARRTGLDELGDLVPWLTLGCLIVACGPWLVAWATLLWSRPHYQFFPLLLLGAGILALRSWNRLGRLQPGRSLNSMILIAIAWLMLLVAEVAYSPTLAAGAVLMVLAALFYGLGGLRLFLAMLPAWAYLWLALPLPFGLDRRLIGSLQSLTTRWSSSVLDLIGIDHLLSGNVVEIAGRRLFVEEACSGIQTLFAVLGCAVFYVLWQRRALIHALALLAAAIGWVLVANVFRVSALAYLSERWGIYLFDGLGHDAVGLGLFLVTIVLILSTDRLLLFFSQSAGAPPPRPVTGEPTHFPALSLTWLGSWLVLLAFSLLVAVQFGFLGLEGPTGKSADPAFEARLSAMTSESLPERFQTWTRRAFQAETRTLSSEFGPYSRTWQYQGPGLEAVVSVDFLFPEWHDLTICYRSQGWEVLEQTSIEHAGLPIIVERLAKPGARLGYLLFVELDGQGQPQRPPRSGFFHRSQRRLSLFGARWLGMTPTTESATAGASPVPLGQVQLFLASHAPMTPQDQEQALALFVEAVQRVQQLK